LKGGKSKFSPLKGGVRGRDISRKGRRGQKKTSERLRGIFVII